MPGSARQTTLLDACAVVNLFASRRMAEIVAAVEGPVAIVDVVEREAQFVFRGGAGDDAREREPIDLRPLLAADLVEVIATDVEEELLTFLDFSQEIGQGEAMTAALAIHRSCVVVTDDRKASRVLRSRGVAIRTSLDLVRAWADRHTLDRARLAIALTDLRQRGTYEPPKSHPIRQWWDDAIRSR